MNSDRHDPKLKNYHLRLTEKNYDKLKKLSAKSGKSMNELINNSVKKSKIEYLYSDNEAEQIRREIIYLHRNFNELNVKANRLMSKTFLDTAEVRKWLAELEDVRAKVNKVVNDFDDKAHR